MMTMNPSPSNPSRGFTLVELLVSLLIVAILVSILLPALAKTRQMAYRSLCGANLKQMGMAWQGYMQEHEQLPQYTSTPDWTYGGAKFVGTDHKAVADAARPINPYLASQSQDDSLAKAITLFDDPADHGITMKDDPGQSILPNGGTCFETFGTSYRANPLLLDSTKAGIDALRRPLRLAEITAQPSKLLLVADPVWFYAVLDDENPEAAYDARWHDRNTRSGNMAAYDGSVRWITFGKLPNPSFTIAPRPELTNR